LSRQNARLFLQTSELGPPHTPPQAGECVPPPFSSGRGHTRLRERGWGGGPNSDEGTDTGTVCGTLGVYVPVPYFVEASIELEKRVRQFYKL
jgi:hypothetical protein